MDSGAGRARASAGIAVLHDGGTAEPSGESVLAGGPLMWAWCDAGVPLFPGQNFFGSVQVARATLSGAYAESQQNSKLINKSNFTCDTHSRAIGWVPGGAAESCNRRNTR